MEKNNNKKLWKSMGPSTVNQNSCVQQKKETHTGLEQHKSP